LNEDDFEKLLEGKLEIAADEKPMAKRSVKSKENGKADKNSQASKPRAVKSATRKAPQKSLF
jgi:hypothetical protein